MCRFHGSFSKMKPCGTSATMPRRSARCCWTEQAFPGRTAMSSRTADPAVLHLGAGTDKAPPQPLERHANLPGIGVQRFDCSAQVGPGQARPHHAELPGGRKTHSAERGWCKTVRLKVENKGSFCSVSSANHRGISFSHNNSAKRVYAPTESIKGGIK